MALLQTSGGHLFVDPQDPNHTVVEPSDTEEIAKAADARVREVGDRADLALERATAAETLAGQADRRVSALEVIAGVQAGDVTDAVVASLLDQTDSLTREAASALARTITNQVIEGATVSMSGGAAVPVESFGAVGDGATDDTEALLQAGASGKVVVFDGQKRYAFQGQIEIGEGAQWITRGATLYELVSANRSSIRVRDNVTVDRLHLSSAGGPDCRGVLVAGSNVVIGDIEVTARERAGTTDDIRRRGVVIGEENIGCRDVQVGEIRVTNFVRAAAMWNPTNVQVGRIDVSGFVQGLYMRNPSHVRISGGRIEHPHEDLMTGGPGENGVLIEATDAAIASGNVVLENVEVYESPEHGFRVGGQTVIEGIRFDKCRAVNPGQGNHTGGCGFKVLGPTSNLSSTARHENVRFLDCEVLGGTWKATPNFAGFNVGKCSGVLISNPVVRPYDGGTEATYFGIAAIGVESMQITNPMFEKCAGPGIGFYNTPDSSTTNWGTDMTSVDINGGMLRNCARGVQVKENGTFRRLTIDGLTIEGGDYSVWVQDTAVMDRCSIRILAGYPSAATTWGCAGVMGHLAGDIVGTCLMRTGSTYQDYSSGAYRLFRGGAWQQLATN